MLQAIRERAQGWIAWVIVILISIPFALWGINQYLGGGGDQPLVTVGDREITQQELDMSYQRYRSQLRARLGPAYNPGLIDEAELRKQVLDSMIRNEVILQSALDMGMRAGDELVKSVILGMSAFQSGGKFDRALYERDLRFERLTPSQFEHRVRAGIVGRQLTQAVQDSDFATPRELVEIQRLQGQKRDLAYLVLPGEAYEPERTPSDEEVTAYYKRHSDAFLMPERVQLAYVELSAKDLSTRIEMPEEDLRAYFEQHRGEFSAPEQRRARHILFSLGEGADAKAKAQAEAAVQRALKRLESGESFEVLAKELSQDPGSAAQGGDLGWFERGIMDPAFEEAAFSMKVGEVRGPVRTAFGLHIIELTDSRSEGVVDFETVRDQVAELASRDRASHLYYEQAEELGNLTYEQPDSLEPAAEALDLEIKTSDWVSHDGGKGVLGSPKVLAAAFSDDVLVRRYNSEPIELGPEHVLVLRVLDHREAQVKPLEEVRERIVEILQRTKGAEQAREMGEALIARLREGASLAEEAASLDREVIEAGPAGREDLEVPPEVLRNAFKLPKPDEGAVVYGQAELKNGDFVVIALRDVLEGASESEDTRGRDRARAVARMGGDRSFDNYVSYLRNHTDIRYTATE
jgi:peptidyl-prolyl cis-trans isomerase D